MNNHRFIRAATNGSEEKQHAEPTIETKDTKDAAPFDGNVGSVSPSSNPATTTRRIHTRLSAFEFRAALWLWQDRIPFRSLTLLDGDPGRGKSTIICDLVARVSIGCSIPCDDSATPVVSSARNALGVRAESQVDTLLQDVAADVEYAVAIQLRRHGIL